MTEHSVTCLKAPMLNISSSNNLRLKHGTLQSHQAARAGIHIFEPEKCKEYVHQLSLEQLNSQAVTIPSQYHRNGCITDD